MDFLRSLNSLIFLALATFLAAAPHSLFLVRWSSRPLLVAYFLSHVMQVLLDHWRISNMEQKCKIKRAKILTKQHHILFSDFNDSIRNKVQSRRYKCELLSIYKLVFFKK